MSRRVRWSCDATVLRLGRELRALGFDVSVTGPQEQRAVLLTRSRRALTDRKLLSLPPTVLLKTAEMDGQLRALESLFAITRSARPWTVCTRCGGRLDRHPADDFRDAVPVFVAETRRWIARCDRCGHLFWRATQTRRQEALWKQILPGIRELPDPTDTQGQ